MKLKTSELQGLALDWVVAKCEGKEVEIDDYPHHPNHKALFFKGDMPADFTFEWTWAGPIIEREGITVRRYTDALWGASMGRLDYVADGPTPLIAAMRCYVASRLGDEVEVPNEIVS